MLIHLCGKGFIPRVQTQGIAPSQAYSDYFETYVERDLSHILQIKDLSSFNDLSVCAQDASDIGQSEQSCG